MACFSPFVKHGAGGRKTLSSARREDLLVVIAGHLPSAERGRARSFAYRRPTLSLVDMLVSCSHGRLSCE